MIVTLTALSTSVWTVTITLWPKSYSLQEYYLRIILVPPRKHQLSIYWWILFGFIFFRNDHFTKFVPSLYQLQTVWTLCRIYFVSLNHIGPTLAQTQFFKENGLHYIGRGVGKYVTMGRRKTWTFFRKGVLKHVLTWYLRFLQDCSLLYFDHITIIPLD